MMTLSRLLSWSVLALALVGGGLIVPGHAAEIVIVACFNGAVPSNPQTCPAGVSDLIDVVSIRSELTNTGASSGGGTGIPQFTPFAIVKRLDSTSPKLFLAAARGEHTRTVGIGIFTTVGPVQTAQRVFSITLTEVFITRIADTAQETRNTTAGASMETVELDFAKIELVDEVSGERACFSRKTGSSC